MMEFNFLWEKRFQQDLNKNNICINVYCYQNKLVFPIHISDQNFENSMDLLLGIDQNKSYYVYIKDLADLCSTKHKIKTKNTFVRIVYSVLVAKMCWPNIKKFV